MSLIHKIEGVGTLCLQPGTACPAYAGGCGIVVLSYSMWEQKPGTGFAIDRAAF